MYGKDAPFKTAKESEVCDKRTQSPVQDAKTFRLISPKGQRMIEKESQ